MHTRSCLWQRRVPLRKKGFSPFFIVYFYRIVLFIVSYCTVYRIVLCCLFYEVCAALIVVKRIVGVDVDLKVVVVVLLREDEALEGPHMIGDGGGDEDTDAAEGCVWAVRSTEASEEALHDALIVQLGSTQASPNHEGVAVMKGDGKEVKGEWTEFVDPNGAEESLVRQQLEVVADVVVCGLPIEEFALADMHCGGSEACGAGVLFCALIA